MKIPKNPQISADVMEKFLSGEKPPVKTTKAYSSADKRPSRCIMYLFRRQYISRRKLMP